ncbi:hypothetical protein PS15m_003389 [Mucor circinelloides]
MPSRNATVSTPKKVKYKVDKVVITPERRVPRKKLEIHVDETSSPEAILHASWEFISAFQFFNTFKSYFHLPKRLSIEKLELAMLAGKDDEQQQQLLQEDEAEDEHAVHLKRESSVLSQQSNASATTPQPTRNYLADFMIHILLPLLTQRQKTLINADNYEQFIADVFPDFTHFADMNVLDKIKVLKSIEMAHVEISDPDLVSLQNFESCQELRFAPLGTDYEGWVYWYFGDYRLYREIPLPMGKKAATISDTSEFTFELMCSTINEWKDTIEKFKPTKRTASRQLASAITALGKEIIAKLEAREEQRLRHEAKMKRARELELIPKKRSRRLEVKSDEQAKRQKILDEAREKEELEEQQRKKLAKEAKLAADRDRQEMQAEETKLRKELFGIITDFILQGQETEADMKPLKAPINSKTSEKERVDKMKGWIKLLGGTISIERLEKNEIQFVGPDADTALESVLFKNTMRIYLATLLLFKLNPITLAYENTEEVHRKLVLNRYDDMDSFTQELNTALESMSDPTVQEDAIGVLTSVFSLDPPQVEESEEIDTSKQEDVTSPVTDTILDTDTANTTTTTTIASQTTPENTTESTAALKIAESAALPIYAEISPEKPAEQDPIKPQTTSLDSEATTIELPSSTATTTAASVPEAASLPQI